MINLVIDKSYNLVTSYKNALKLDLRDIELKIERSELYQEQLKIQLEKKKNEIIRKYDIELIPSILSRIRNALESNIDQLTDAALVGQSELQSYIQSILRPIIASIPDQIKSSVTNIFTNIDIAIPSGTNEDNNNLKQILSNVVDMVVNIPSSNNKIPGRTGPTGTPGPIVPIPTIMTILGGVATFFKPVLGVVALLAPIISGLFSSNKNQEASLEQNRRSQIRAVIENNVIPNVESNIRSNISSAVAQSRDDLIDEVVKQMNISMEKEKEILNQTLAQKEHLTQEHTNKVNAIENSLKELAAMYIKL